MRTLKFIVNDQIIERDPSCDFSGLVPGTKGYLQAEFSFSPEWKDCVKLATFYSKMGKEYTPQVLKDGKTCMIPAEVLVKRIFKIQLIGGTKDGLKLTTNIIEINQNGGKK